MNAPKTKEEALKGIIEARLKICQEDNGRAYCKNCGLCEEDLLSE